VAILFPLINLLFSDFFFSVDSAFNICVPFPRYEVVPRCGGSAANTAEENSGVFSLSQCTSCIQQGHKGVKLCSGQIVQFVIEGAG